MNAGGGGREGEVGGGRCTAGTGICIHIITYDYRPMREWRTVIGQGKSAASSASTI